MKEIVLVRTCSLLVSVLVRPQLLRLVEVDAGVRVEAGAAAAAASSDRRGHPTDAGASAQHGEEARGGLAT